MDIDRNILDRYFLGQCSENEKNVIKQWLESDEKNQKEFTRERIRFDASLLVDEQKVGSSHSGKLRRMAWNVLKVAASVVLLIGCAYWMNIFWFKSEAVIQTVYVPPGNRTSLILPDGSLVWLNSNTSLKYPSVFGKKQRLVELDGEAYFEVISNNKSFIVKSDKYNVEVLGTTFNVNAYKDKPGFETALFTGKVKLYSENMSEEPYFLKAGETASLEDNRILISSNKMNHYRWRDGLIVFDGESFEEIMLLFEKYFGIHIVIQNSKVVSQGYRGKLRIADGVDHALRVLQKDINFTYERNEITNNIHIH